MVRSDWDREVWKRFMNNDNLSYSVLFGWLRLVAGADMWREKNTVGWLVLVAVADLVWEKNMNKNRVQTNLSRALPVFFLGELFLARCHLQVTVYKWTQRFLLGSLRSLMHATRGVIMLLISAPLLDDGHVAMCLWTKDCVCKLNERRSISWTTFCTRMQLTTMHASSLLHPTQLWYLAETQLQ